MSEERIKEQKEKYGYEMYITGKTLAECEDFAEHIIRTVAAEAREEIMENEQKPLSDYTQEELSSLDERMNAGEAELLYAWEKGRKEGIDACVGLYGEFHGSRSGWYEEFKQKAERLKEKKG